MKRRHLLGLVGTAFVAGCTGNKGATTTGTTLQDSDGDGVVDSQDYAPHDPDVQSKSDLVTTAETTKRTTTNTRTTTPTTRATTTHTTTTTTPTVTRTTVSADPNSIEVDEGMPAGQSGIVSYSSTGVTAQVNPDDPGLSDFTGESVKLLAYATTYPRDEDVARGESEAFRLRETETVRAAVDLSGAPTNTRLQYLAFLVPADVAPEDLTASNSTMFHETDGFSLHTNGVTISRDPHPNTLSDDAGDGYERRELEGAYELSFSGTTQGMAWSSNFYIYKSAYLRMALEPRGRSRPEYVEYAQKRGFAGELAAILDEDADQNGITGKRGKVEFVIDFVQNFPYVPDDVSTGFDDYTKFSIETIAEAGGDCEDTAILLAAVLQAEPFGYDMVLIQPPGHMAAGIYGKDDLPGYYWERDGRKYYYIETTGEGWGIGDLPDEYQDETAYVYQV